jgi:hypothetical protein
LVLGREQGFFFFQVCKGRVGWGGARSSTRGLGEIWLQVRNESKRKFGTLVMIIASAIIVFQIFDIEN